MKNIGIIDIGSNSFRLVTAQIDQNRSYKILDELKETVRLGEDLEKTMTLKESRIKVAIKTLKMFKHLCNAFSVEEIIAVATAAVRKAKNQKEFLERVKNEVDIDVRVLAGQEESFYNYWGVVNSIDIADGLIMDIGGGSIELVLMKDRKAIEKESLPFGALDLTERFGLKDRVSNKLEENLREFLYEQFSELSWLKDVDSLPLVGVGGTMRNIGKIDRRKKQYPLQISHNYCMKAAEVHDVYYQVMGKPLKKRKKISGLSKSRADIFVGAAAAVSVLIELCNIKQLLISGSGIREGLLYHYITPDQPVQDVLDFSIENIMKSYQLNRQHSEHVYNLTSSLYQQLQPIHRLDKIYSGGVDIDKIIKTASMLHDCGINLSYYRHHEHSFYMILHSGIKGLNQKELVMSALTAAEHRSKKNRVSWKDYKGLINKRDKNITKKLGVLLRIVESLDRSMEGVVQKLDCEIDEDEVRIKTRAEDIAELEIQNAMTAAKKFKKRFNRKLIIE